MGQYRFDSSILEVTTTRARTRAFVLFDYSPLGGARVSLRAQPEPDAEVDHGWI